MDKAEIIKIAVEAAKDYDQKQRIKNIKSRYDKRLRNTKLLLKNYRLLKDHCESAIFDKKELIDIPNGNIIDLLDSLEECDRQDYIESIKNSVSRTQVILEHIDTMMEIYRIYCDQSEKPEEQRRYAVMKHLYLEGMKSADICKAEGIEQRTYYRDINGIAEMMSALIFGVDGLSAMTKR